MGGSIAVVIRHSEDIIHKMVRWTNIMPNHILDPDFRNQGDSYMKFIGHWSILQQELVDYFNKYGTTDYWIREVGMYSKSLPKILGDDDDYTLGITWGMTKDGGKTLPDGYGIILIDFITKTILALGDYSRSSSTMLFSIYKGAEREDIVNKICKSKFMRFSHVQSPSSEVKVEIPEKFNNFDLLSQFVTEQAEDLCEMEHNLTNGKHSENCLYLLIEQDNWNVIDFEQNNKQYSEYYKALKKIKFPLTKEEKSAWLKLINEEEN